MNALAPSGLQRLDRFDSQRPSRSPSDNRRGTACPSPARTPPPTRVGSPCRRRGLWVARDAPRVAGVPPARPPSPEDTALPRALSDSVSDRRSSLHQRAQTLQQLRLRFVFVKFIILHDIFIIIYDFVGRPNFIHYYQYIIDRIFDNRCRSSIASSVFSPSTLGHPTASGVARPAQLSLPGQFDQP